MNLVSMWRHFVLHVTSRDPPDGFFIAKVFHMYFFLFFFFYSKLKISLFEKGISLKIYIVYNIYHFDTVLDITKIYLYNFDPIKPHFYIVKLGFTGVYIIFLFLLKNIDCGYALEPPQRGGSNGYPQSMFLAEIWKIWEFLSENFQLFVVKFSVYLNIRIFVMKTKYDGRNYNKIFFQDNIEHQSFLARL